MSDNTRRRGRRGKRHASPHLIDPATPPEERHDPTGFSGFLPPSCRRHSGVFVAFAADYGERLDTRNRDGTESPRSAGTDCAARSLWACVGWWTAVGAPSRLNRKDAR